MSGKKLPFSRFMGPLLLCVLAAVAGTGLGWLGRSMRGNAFPAASGKTAENVAKIPAASSAEAAEISRAAGRRAEALHAILTGKKGVGYWLRLLAAAENAKAPELARLIDLLGDEPAALSVLGIRWAQLDAPGMFAALKRWSQGDGKSSTAFKSAHVSGDLQKILTGEWLRQNPDALIDALHSTNGMNGMRPARQELLNLLASTRPELALQLTIEWRMRLKAEDSTALGSWVRTHAARAMEMLLATKVYYPNFGDAGEVILEEASKVLAAGDPAAILAGLPDYGEGAHKFFARQIVKEWAKRDLAAAVDWFAKENANRVLSTEMTQPLLEVWGAADPVEALAWANRHLKGTAKQNAAGSLVETIARQDPAKAVGFIHDLEPGASRNDAMRKLTSLSIRGKGKPELLAAFQWMMAMPDPVLRRVAMDSGAREITKAAPEAVMAYLNSPAGTDAPDLLLINAASFMSLKDGAAAVEWASSLRPDVSAKVRWSALGSWLERDPVAAADWVRHQPAGDDRTTDVAAITLNMANRKGEEGLNAWLATLPASDHAAIRQGLGKAWELDPAVKARLEAKYR